MPTSAYNKFNVFAKDVLNAVHNFSTHVFKVMLTNTAPVATNSIKADITEIAAANGYTAGGPVVTMTISIAGGTAKVTAASVTITAAGGSIGPFRYAVLYNDTQTTPVKPLIDWLDYGQAQTVLDGESLNITYDQTNGLFTIN